MMYPHKDLKKTVLYLGKVPQCEVALVKFTFREPGPYHFDDPVFELLRRGSSIVLVLASIASASITIPVSLVCGFGPGYLYVISLTSSLEALFALS